MAIPGPSTGRSRHRPARSIPNLWIGPDRILLQIDKPNQLLVLKTEDGEPIARSMLAESESLERPPFPLDEDSVLLVTDRRTVKKFDLNHGQTTWVYRESTSWSCRSTDLLACSEMPNGCSCCTTAGN